ncbi:hypothetical protein D477_005171 [Arthrobacter crystallopoietes BAB-32]|uniref:Uncharacterized protein n=1 Tax=Arthrobacter crystallopoietes BAB-32 TaxID=1246476 RepID=N1V595_9MICC|nr:DUF6541 family protein [Arthrobacter crystallopoietes]EMY35252.1 hypothetical protein D477_005171 [Arthrobacter crystallopoietes BAB-32]
MTWPDALWPALAVLASFYVPGLLVLSGLRLPLLAAIALAPAASAAVAAAGTMACLATGIEWTPISAAAATILAAAAAFLLGRWIRPPALEPEHPVPAPVKLLALGTLAVAGVVIAATMMAGIGRPDRVSQAWIPPTTPMPSNGSRTAARRARGASCRSSTMDRRRSTPRAGTPLSRSHRET